MEALVQIVYFGEVIEGFDTDDVKRRVRQLLKLDDAKLSRLFSGDRTVLKRSLTAPDAQRYLGILAKAGMRAHVEAGATPPPPSPAPRTSPLPRPPGLVFPTLDTTAGTQRPV